MNKLKYYSFDLDDNLLKMPSLINMLVFVNDNWEPVKITTHQFANIRQEFKNWKLDTDAFESFGDSGIRGTNAFLEDLKQAIGGKVYPEHPVQYASKSWDKFIEAIINGSLISIITARGHSSVVLRQGVEWIVNNYLGHSERITLYVNCKRFSCINQDINNVSNINLDLDLDNITKCEYVASWLDKCEFHGVSSPEFIELYKCSMESPEVGKEIALKSFISNCNSYSESLGIPFEAGISDDDLGNLLHLKTTLSDLLKIYPGNKFTLFDTSNGGYKKTIIKN